MALTNKENYLINQVVSKINNIDPEAFVKITLDTIEDEDVDILVFTDKNAMEILQNTSRMTVDILTDNGLNIIVLPMKKESLSV